MAAVMPITVSVVRLRRGGDDVKLGGLVGGLSVGMSALVQGMRHHIIAPDQAVGQDRKECEGIQKTDHELNTTGLYLVRQPDILSYTQRP